MSDLRPGGGQRYSGGGSRSGGGYSGGGYHGGGPSFGGGGGAADPFFTLIGFVLVAIILIVVLIARRRASAAPRAGIALAEYEATRAVRRSVSLDALRARDPNITEESITNRVRQMADILRDAWCAGDMRPARAFVSDGVFSRFHVQLALMRAAGLRNVMGDAGALYVTLEAVETSPPLDVVHVRFTAQARDAMVPANATQDEIAATLARTPVEPYTEIWSLVRRTGATTKPAEFRVGAACASCGAPLEQGQMIKCKYCGALVCSGEHDWVLAEITQLSEWHPHSAGARGLDALRAQDPEVVREVLEDRASFLFWKWIEAACANGLAPVRKCATPAFVGAGAQLAEARGVSDVAVGGAEVVAIDPGEPLDYAYVKIYWSAAAVPHQSILRLARKHGVKAKASFVVVCHACGAPLSESDSPRCDHCGAELTAGDQAWVLDGVLPPGEVRARSSEARDRSDFDWLVPNIADPRERIVLFCRMAQLMAASGGIDRRERRLLELCATRWSIPTETLERTLANPPGGTDVSKITSSSPRWFLAGLVSAALADGTLDPTERAMLERVCAALELPSAELERQIAACRERMRSWNVTA